MKSVEFNLPVSSRERASEGCNQSYDPNGPMRYWRLVRVDTDGTVRAEDPISEGYSLHHDLQPEEEERARDLAGKLWAGTHYTSAGWVKLKKTFVPAN